MHPRATVDRALRLPKQGLIDREVAQIIGMTEIKSYSKHWPCLFPQHGPGMKHTRKIELADWQQVIADRYPGDFARGLFHSDGYRGMNIEVLTAFTRTAARLGNRALVLNDRPWPSPGGPGTVTV